MKLLEKLRKTPKRTSAIVAMLAAAIIVPAAVFAWGPSRATFTTASPADYITFNSITDNPSHGDERNFVQVREATASNTTYADSISLSAGKEYVVYMYFHNNAAANLNLTALNTTARAEVPAVVKQGASAKAVGYISASNANPTQVWDDITFQNKTAGDIALRFVPGSATIHSFGAVDGKTLGDSIVTTGSKLGYNSLDGKVPGCNQYAGYVTFRVKADQPNFEITKQVRLAGTTDWSESVKANPGDTVDYLIGYKNTGTTQQNNVVLKDTLPAGITYVAGSTVLKNATYPNMKTLSDNLTTSTGINIGSYTAGSNAFVRFSAKVASKDKLSCGNSTLTNTVKAETANGSKTDTAKVTVSVTCETPKIDVCELATGKIITIKETDFDSSKQSKNLADCDAIEVCELSSKTVVAIKKNQYDETKYSKDLSDCETIPTTPPELPKTGAGDVAAFVSLAALATSAGYYINSRRLLGAK